MPRFATVLGLSSVLFAQNVIASPSAQSSDKVEKMKLLRKSLEDVILASVAHSFTSVDLEKIREAAHLEPSLEQRAVEAAKAEFVGETLVKLAKEEV